MLSILSYKWLYLVESSKHVISMNKALRDSITSTDICLESKREGKKKHSTLIIGTKKHQSMKRNLIQIKVKIIVGIQITIRTVGK